MADHTKLTDAALEALRIKLGQEADDLRAERQAVKAEQDRRALAAQAARLIEGMTPGQVDAIAYASRANANADARTTPSPARGSVAEFEQLTKRLNARANATASAKSTN